MEQSDQLENDRHGLAKRLGTKDRIKADECTDTTQLFKGDDNKQKLLHKNVLKQQNLQGEKKLQQNWQKKCKHTRNRKKWNNLLLRLKVQESAILIDSMGSPDDLVDQADLWLVVKDGNQWKSKIQMRMLDLL